MTDRRDDRGANLVEMALVLPLLLMLFMGIVDFGRAYYSYVTLTNAAREGARFASRFPYEGNEEIIGALVAQRVVQEPGLSNIPVEDIVVTYVGLGSPKGSPVTVRAALPFRTIVGGMFGFQPLQIRTEATMRIFGVDALP
jgi:hypothetical protein